MDLVPAEMVRREINHTTWKKELGAPGEGKAHLVPIQFLPLFLVFAKADMLPAALDPLQYLRVYQAGDGINHIIHKWKVFNQRVS